MPSKDESERLLKHDDFATSLIVDPLMGFKRLKLSGRELPPFQPQDEDAIKKILESVKSTQDLAKAVVELLNCDWAKAAVKLDKMDKKEKMELESHLKMYLNGLTDVREFAIEKTERYNMEGNEGGKIVAKKRMTKGKKIETLLGKTAAISEEQEKNLRERGVDTSCIIEGSKSLLVVNGVVAFVNHDCEPNCKFYALPSGWICVQALKEIEPGEEITIHYAPGYFGRNQKTCQCPTCQSRGTGSYRKRKQGEREDQDLYTLEEENKIVKVCLQYRVVGVTVTPRIQTRCLYLINLNILSSIFSRMAASLVEGDTFSGRRLRPKASLKEDQGYQSGGDSCVTPWGT